MDQAVLDSLYYIGVRVKGHVYVKLRVWFR